MTGMSAPVRVMVERGKKKRSVASAFDPGGGQYGYEPTYSPDDSGIVFVRENDVCRMDADRSNVTRLMVHGPGTNLNHVAWGMMPSR